MERKKTVSVTLPDGSKIEVESGITASELAKGLGEGLFKKAIAAKINNQLVDLSFKIEKDSSIKIITYNDPEAQEIILHTTAHVMAQAVKRLYPDAKIAIGPALEKRFYYDIDVEPPIKEDDLPRIEEEMRKIIKADHPIERVEMTRSEAIEFFADRGEIYKVEILNDIVDTEVVSIYRQDDFVDLCRGPHLPSTGKIRAFKLLSVAGAYWRGDSRNKMLTRIYGTSFPTREALNKYLKFLEEAKKRDHRVLGRQLELFDINENVGPGLVLWFPKGTIIRKIIEDLWIKEHLERGYQLVQTPHIGKARLWEISGHLGFYRESMFDAMKVENDEYYVKPMNCPFHIMIYKSKTRSYRDLPIKYAELGTVYRYELSGVLHGLMRVRGFTQDDAHIICTPEQLDEEIEKLVEFSISFLRNFGFENFDIYVSTRPEEKFTGSIQMWDVATYSLKKALEKLNIDYSIDEGGGAFYGPKIDIKIRDALERSWQCTTIQFDFNLPERFDMSYIAEDGTKKRPYMIHRAILGSIERFVGILLEHSAGDFPVWLAPVQAVVLPITDKQADYACEVFNYMKERGIRVELNNRSQTIGQKIREAELQKIPFMLIIGEKEVSTNRVSVRRRKKGSLGVFTWEETFNLIKEGK
ncbi:MAG: threonine--tRNA ligase [Candidatus Neomarinimicrobiota bacterium]|nr:threonine--tRNA ligase [Candidatus Neomarinimicrobiota bacterium]RKY49048.1 MAG: threonine--tRNA ligase [Candidatus Neomarinimicrobiota bacterium]RKY53303.1 MAG: threonine--tRNA ligase [Candidatus Neomarinimicrobiota bacterium]HDN59036.1 threonine--tRNA ligase [Candidatus Neomarinimicrobiota bacterium]